jgi:prephenate dehydrogenase
MAVASVIGGAGRMGAWFATFLKKNGYRVIICDKDKTTARNLARKKGFWFVKDPKLAAQLSDLVILATPIPVTRGLLRQIEPHLSPATLLVEMSSVKEPLRRTLQQMRRRGIAILSIHPMFGPGIKTLAGQAIITVLLPRSNLTAKKFVSHFRKKGTRMIQSDFARHDRLAAITLALPHFMNIALVNTLKSIGVPPNQLREIAGTTFKLQLLIAEAIYHETFGNEASILMDSKQSVNALRKFARESQRILSHINSGRRGDLLRSLGNGREFVGKDKTFSSAYIRFSAAVEALSPD